jgi:hypothetical protein
VHGAVTLNGPGVWIIRGLLLATWALAAYVVIDSARRPATAFEVTREGRLFYLVPQALYFFFVMFAQIPNAPVVGAVALVGMPFALAHQVAYLLRVTFPTRARIEARQAAEKQAAVDGPLPDEQHTEGASQEQGGQPPLSSDDEQAEAPDDPVEEPFRDEHY